MFRIPRTLLVIALIIASMTLMVGVVFALDRATNGGEVLGRLVAVDVQLGGLNRDQAVTALTDLEEKLLSEPVIATAAGQEFQLNPADIGFDLNERAIADDALEEGRRGHLGSQFTWWIRHITGTNSAAEMYFTVDEAELRRIIASWEVDGIDDPASPGSVSLENGELIPHYPATGTGIDPDESTALLLEALVDPERAPVELPLRVLEPPLTNGDIDAIIAEAEQIVATDIRLIDSRKGHELVIPADVLAEALLVIRDDGTSPPSFEYSFDAETLADYLGPAAESVESDPVDAELYIDDMRDVVRILPSSPALELDTEALADAATTAALSVTRTAEIPYRAGAEPEVTTADIEALGIKELIGEFTTYHNCCESRVINIQLIADSTEGALVMPGETWSLNEYVGPRTIAKGYVRAGAIWKGELVCCDQDINIGGGTSQFTTTLYNAFFFAGLEDAAHTPHSIYFSRYPEGREATLGYPVPDLSFRNNTENAVIIMTSHTDTSITAKVYGDNGGLVVEAGLSNRYNFSSIQSRIEYDDTLDPGVTIVKAGSPGWSVDIFRYITYPDGTTSEEMWTWHYTGAIEITRMHSCHKPGNTCPAPEPP
jgi:vancomycin resistance protein YoaR